MFGTTGFKVIYISFKSSPTGLRRRYHAPLHLYFSSRRTVYYLLFRMTKSAHQRIRGPSAHFIQVLHPWKWAWYFFISLCRKILLMGFTRETSLWRAYQVTFSFQATRRWADERHRKQDALEQPSSPFTIFFFSCPLSRSEVMIRFPLACDLDCH